MKPKLHQRLPVRSRNFDSQVTRRMSDDNGREARRDRPEGRLRYEPNPVDQSSLAHRDERLPEVLEDLEDGYYEVDLRGNFTAANEALCRMHRLDRGRLIGRNNRDYTDPDVAARMYEIFNSVYRTGEPVKVFNYEVTRADGTAGVRETSVHLVRDDTGRPIGFRGITRDVTERRRNEAYEQARNRALELLARNAPLNATLAEVLGGLHVQMPDSAAAILTLSDDGRSFQCSASAGRAKAYLQAFPGLHPRPEGTLIERAAHTQQTIATACFAGGTAVDRDPAAVAAGFRSGLAQPILSGERDVLGILLLLWERKRVVDARETGWLQSATATAEIAISHHQLVSRLAYLSEHDTLTGLLNRRSFIENGTRGLAMARRHNWTAGLLYLDLDRFKPVNDTWGHLAGDRLLTTVATRLEQVVRESDCLARLGGDEFAIFAPDLGRSGPAALAERALERLREPMDLGIGRSLSVNSSIGIALASPEQSLDTLLARADGAMYLAKSAGGGWRLAEAD